jgi:hypothetical protein
MRSVKYGRKERVQRVQKFGKTRNGCKKSEEVCRGLWFIAGTFKSDVDRRED